MEKMKKLETKLRKTRKALGLTQTELASRLGISCPMVSQQEKRGCTTVAMAKQYARVLNCNPLDLIEL